MYKRKNIITRFYRLLANPADHIAMLEQSLVDTREMLNGRIKESTALKEELRYVYEILQRRTGCRIDVKHDEDKRLILFTTSCDATIKNTIAYIPREQSQIAEINTCPTDEALLIKNIHLDFVQCNRWVGKFIVQRLMAQARDFYLPLIVGHFQDVPNVSFEEQAEYYRQAGFEVVPDTVSGAGTLTCRLKTEELF